MGVVESCVLGLSILDDDKLDLINEYFKDDKWGGFTSIDDDKIFSGKDKWYGGRKFMEHTVAVGAFVGFERREFMTYLSTLTFSNPEDLQLYVMEEEEYKFTTYTLKEGRGKFEISYVEQIITVDMDMPLREIYLRTKEHMLENESIRKFLPPFKAHVVQGDTVLSLEKGWLIVLEPLQED